MSFLFFIHFTFPIGHIARARAGNIELKMPPFAEIGAEALFFHRRFEQEPVFQRFAFGRARMALRREGVEVGAHVERLPVFEVDEAEVDGGAVVVAGASGDVAAVEERALTCPLGPGHHGVGAAPRSVGVVDDEAEALLAEAFLDAFERLGGRFEEPGFGGAVAVDGRAGEVVRAVVADVEDEAVDERFEVDKALGRRARAVWAAADRGGGWSGGGLAWRRWCWCRALGVGVENRQAEAGEAGGAPERGHRSRSRTERGRVGQGHGTDGRWAGAVLVA